jgi:hypothetical protein
MGRPIKNQFINAVGAASGGEGANIASLTVHGGNSFSAGTTITFPTPPTGGTAATGTIAFVTPAVNSLQGNGNISSVSMTVTSYYTDEDLQRPTAGSGYLVRNIKATFTKPANVVVDGVTGFYGLGAAGTVVKFSSGVTSGIYAGMVANVFFTTLAFGNPTRVVSVDTASGNITFSTANTAAISSPISFGDVGFNGNVVLQIFPTVTQGNTIQSNAWITSGTSGRVADILRQKGSRRYRVTNDQGTDVVRLVPTGINGNEDATNPSVANITAYGGPSAPGQMTIQATDSAGGTYWVGKLEGQTALVFPGGTGTPGTQFTANTHVIWSMNAAVVDTTVKLATND